VALRHAADEQVADGGPAGLEHLRHRGRGQLRLRTRPCRGRAEPGVGVQQHRQPRAGAVHGDPGAERVADAARLVMEGGEVAGLGAELRGGGERVQRGEVALDLAVHGECEGAGGVGQACLEGGPVAQRGLPHGGRADHEGGEQRGEHQGEQMRAQAEGAVATARRRRVRRQRRRGRARRVVGPADEGRGIDGADVVHGACADAPNVVVPRTSPPPARAWDRIGRPGAISSALCGTLPMVRAYFDGIRGGAPLRAHRGLELRAR
jgi:hypothetical protein